MAKHLQSYICRDLENLFLFMFSSLFNQLGEANQ